MTVEETILQTIRQIEEMQRVETNAIAYLSGLIFGEALKKTEILKLPHRR